MEIYKHDCFIPNLIINEVTTYFRLKTDLENTSYAYYFRYNCILLDEFLLFDFNYNVMNIFGECNTKLSFIDCTIIEIMKMKNIEFLVSFDKYFKRKIQ